MISLSELGNYQFFEGLTEAELSALASIAVPMQCKEGETLFQARSTATHLYILKSGTVLLSYPSGSSIPLVNSGHALGWSSLVSPFRHTGTAICLTDTTLFQFAGSDLYRLLQMDSHLAQTLMQRIARVMEQRKPYYRSRHRARK